MSPDASALCLEALVFLAVGGAAIVLLAAGLERILRGVVAHRGVWRAGLLGLALLVAAEVSGARAVIARYVRVPARGPDASTLIAARNQSPVMDAEAPSRGRDGAVGSPGSRPVAATTDAADGGGTLPASIAALEVLDVGPRLTSPGHREPLAGLPALGAADSSVPGRPVGGPAAQGEGRWTRLGSWVGIPWLIGSIILLLRLAVSHVLLELYRLRLLALDDAPLLEALDRLRHRLGVRRRVRLRAATTLRGPLTFGLFRPVVVLPADFRQDFQTPRTDVILAHEVSHIACLDAAWQAVADAVCAVLWWHPLAWWARHRLEEHSEYAADEASRLVEEGPRALAECLVRLGRRLLPPAARSAHSVEGFRSTLGRRVHRLLSMERASALPAPSHIHLFTTLTLSLALSGGTLWGSAWPLRGADQEHGGSTMSHDFLHRSLAGLLLAAVMQSPGAELAAREDTTPKAPASRKVPLNTPAPPSGIGAAPALPGTPGTAPRPQDGAQPPGAGAGEEGDAPSAIPLGILDPSSASPAPPGAAPPQQGRELLRLGQVGLVPGVPMAGAQAGARPGDSDLAGPRAIRPDAAGMTVDLLALATALSDAESEIELRGLELEESERLGSSGLNPVGEVARATLRLKAAERKLALYRRIAGSCRRVAKASLDAQLQRAALFEEAVKAGRISGSVPGELNSQIAHAEGQLEILESILADQGSSGVRGRSAESEAAPIVIDAGGLIPGSTRWDQLLESLSAVPERSRGARRIEIRDSGDLKDEKLVTLIALINEMGKLGFQDIRFTRAAAAARPQGKQ